MVGAVGYLVLTLAVVTGLTERVDDAVYLNFRPDGRWDPLQENVRVLVVDRVRPLLLVTALLVVVLALSAWRRSWRPLCVAGVLLIPTGVIVESTKWLVDRHNTEGVLVPHDGSYPSGHTALAVVSLTGIALLLLRRPIARGTLVVLATAGWIGLGLSYLIVGLHWWSDVIGGVLIGLTVVCLVPKHCWLGPPPNETTGFRRRDDVDERVRDSLPDLHNR